MTRKLFFPCPALFLLFFPLLLTAQNRPYQVPKFAADWSKPGKHPDHIVLNYSDNPAKTISITWRTSPQVTEGYAEIALATAAPKFWRNAVVEKAKTFTMNASKVYTAEVVSNYHSVTFRGLIPDTLYAYRVGDGEIWSEWIQFRTASDKPKPFSFLYVGDAQNYILELWSRLIREGYRKAPDAGFIIHAGDLINNAHSEREWHEWFSAGGWIHRMLPSLPLPGNHEYEPYIEGESEQHLSVQWNPQFTLPKNGIETLPETNYFLDYQDVRFVVLNSMEQHEEQARWLRKVLQKNPQKWTIAAYHHPLYSASEGRDNQRLRKLWKPLFDKFGVDLALQGHDHSYARGRSPVKGENIVDGSNTRDQKTGTVYVVSVSGGKMYNLRPNAWDDFESAERDRAAENTQLFQVIRIDEDTLSFKAYTATGQLYDAFDLIKAPEGGPNIFVEGKQEAIAARGHDNTITYKDELPDALRHQVAEKHPGYVIDKINYVKEGSFIGYYLELEKGNWEVHLKIDQAGNILEERIEKD